MANPIRPEEAVAAKLAQFPDGVIDTFNDLIAERFDGSRAVIDQNDVVHALLELGIVSSAHEVFDRHLLDVEPVYRAWGWKVTYDKPGFNEPGRALFTFARDGRAALSTEE